MKAIDCVVIPARGGSKRILRKNMQPFCGVPMLQRSIELGRKVSDFVLVSSDDEEILAFANAHGAYPITRSAALANDSAPTLPVITHALLPFLNDEAYQFVMRKNKAFYKSKKQQCAMPSLQIRLDSKVLCLYATAMFATQEVLLESCAMLTQHREAAYIVAMIDAAKSFRAFTRNDEGFLQFLFPEFLNTRSQDLPQAFFDAGQFYLGYAQSFLEEIALLGQKSMGIVLPYAHDIDTPLDLLFAQSMFSHLNASGMNLNKEQE